MKKILTTAVLALSAMISVGQILPKGSPLCKTTQIVGASEISLSYSRPGVKGREIFGKLLPYGQLWRLGANASTKFTTSDTLQFEQKKLSPGTYALFAIPKDSSSWEVIFNSNYEQSGTANYSSELDVIRLSVKTKLNSFTETLTLNIDQVKNESASLVILWDKVRVEIPFTINTNSIAIKNIEAAIEKGESLGKVYSNAGDFYFSTLNDNRTSLYYTEKALEINRDFRSLFLKARIIMEQGKKKEAIVLAKEALVKAESEGVKGFAGFIASTIAKWGK